MDCMGLTGSGTTFITFEDVKVPVANLLGKHNQGFRIIMHNFNHERFDLFLPPFSPALTGGADLHEEWEQT